MTLVVDASVVAGWVLKDERTPYTDQVLARVEVEGAVVPALWAAEVANMLLVGVRRTRLAAAEAYAALALLGGLPIRVDDQDSLSLLAGVFAAADQAGLTAYDACYLELAVRRSLALATLDSRLRSAAQQRGVAPA